VITVAGDPIPAAPPRDVAELQARAARVRERIAAAGGDPAAITLVAVTKGLPVGLAALALEAGLEDLGENYAQELLSKHEQLGAAAARVRWHFIGQLQRNKVAKLAPVVDVWETVDRVELGTAIARHAPGATVFAQVNVSGEPQKGGCLPDAAPDLVAALRDLGLAVRGLMTVGATGAPEAARDGFRTLRRLADRLGLVDCSMGMSGDLEVAVAEGATIVRVGTALMGRRTTTSYVRD
jgi:pyridoxal phosphate enzyme (YggS family)